MSNFLGVDIGTSSIKTILLDSHRGKIISQTSLPTPIHQSMPGMDEHNPEALFATVADCIRHTVHGYSVNALGISSLAEAGLPLDNSGKPLYPIIAWYDRRSQAQADQILQTFSEDQLFRITGQKLSFSFGLFKYQWIKENISSRLQDMAVWLSIPDYILYRLTGSKATEYTQASRTMLFDQAKKIWSPELLAYAGLESIQLPELFPSGTVRGTVTKAAAQQTGLPIELPCVLGGHDHLCGAFASGGTRKGMMIDSSGTACALLALTDIFNPIRKIAESGYVNYCYVMPHMYILKGGLKAAGKALDWLARLCFQQEHLDSRTMTAHYQAGRKNPLIWLPYFISSGTPDKTPLRPASLVGLTLEHTCEDIAIALYEGLGFWLRHNLDTLREITGTQPEAVIAIGGTNQDPLLRQVKASITNIPIAAPDIPEASAVGAALLAAIGTGSISSFEKAPEILDYPTSQIEPDALQVRHYNSVYENIYLPAREKLAGLMIQ